MKKMRLFSIFIIALGLITIAFFVGMKLLAPYKVLIINTNLSAKELGGYDLLQEKIIESTPAAHVLIMHYEAVTQGVLDAFHPSAVILGGQGTPWTLYPPEKLDSFKKVIRELDIPVLGICGGHQLIALSYNCEVSPIKILDPTKPGYEGCWRENGFIHVSLIKEDDPLFMGLSAELTVYENHCDEVKNLSSDLILISEGTDSKLQAFRHKSKPIYGVQFHPEAYDEAHPDGKKVLANFTALR